MKVLSRITSRHHWIIDIIIINIAKYKHQSLEWWNQFANPIARVSAPIDAVRGHGLYSTIGFAN